MCPGSPPPKYTAKPSIFHQPLSLSSYTEYHLSPDTALASFLSLDLPFCPAAPTLNMVTRSDRITLMLRMPQWHPMAFMQKPYSDLGSTWSGLPQLLHLSYARSHYSLYFSHLGQPPPWLQASNVHSLCLDHSFSFSLPDNTFSSIIFWLEDDFLWEGSLLEYYHLLNLAKIMKECL